MWAPIFLQNKEHVLDVLNEHIAQLKKFRDVIQNENRNELKNIISNANTIRRIIK
jgi:prephenate dehydrogenase